MAILTIPKVIFDHSLKLAKLPLDAALGMFDSADSSAEVAEMERERAAYLREEAKRRESKAEEELRRKAEAERRKRAKATQEAKRAKGKRDKAAQIKKLDAKEGSLDAKEAAVRARPRGRASQGGRGKCQAGTQGRRRGCLTSGIQSWSST